MRHLAALAGEARREVLGVERRRLRPVVEVPEPLLPHQRPLGVADAVAELKPEDVAVGVLPDEEVEEVVVEPATGGDRRRPA